VADTTARQQTPEPGGFVVKLQCLGALASAAIRAEFQYRANVVSSTIGGFIYQLTGFVTIWIIVARFSALGGWSLADITFLYGMRLASHGVFYACFSQMFEIDRVLVTGEYDRFMLRPMPTLAQLFTRKLRINCLGDLAGGALLLVVATVHVQASWTVWKVVLLVFAVLGGAMIEGSVQIILGSFSFRILNMLAIRMTGNEIFNLYGNYPTKIFPTVVEYLLTFALPVAFVAYFPASAILDRTQGLTVAPWVAWGAPALGVALFALAVNVWRWQGRNYQSSGT
jgi:ABC-2 type transport system permease protein